MSAVPRRVLVAAGFEPSGRMGLLADLRALRDAGVEGLGIATALTAQGGRTFLCEPVASGTVAAQATALLESGPIDAVKLGVVPSLRVLEALVRVLPHDVPWVVDPVVRSSSGKRLSRLVPADYHALGVTQLILTPNFGEALWLLGCTHPESGVAEMVEAATALVATAPSGVVLKGGHLLSAKIVDVVANGAGVTLLTSARVRRTALGRRGTGCRFAAVLAAEFSKGEGLVSAARTAQQYVCRYLRQR